MTDKDEDDYELGLLLNYSPVMMYMYVCLYRLMSGLRDSSITNRHNSHGNIVFSQGQYIEMM